MNTNAYKSVYEQTPGHQLFFLFNFISLLYISSENYIFLSPTVDDRLG